ncbi:DUF5839 family protein [Clostridium perfringens]
MAIHISKRKDGKIKIINCERYTWGIPEKLEKENIIRKYSFISM